MLEAPPLGEVFHGPASAQTRALERTLRRTWIPLARSWRLTPRGIRLLKRVTDPSGRVPVLRGTRVVPARVGGRPAEWVLAPRALEQPGVSPHAAPATDAPILLYLHGGGYVFGSPRTHRNLVSRLSHVSGLAALSLDYRLPPEATLPAPIEDALAAYAQLLAEGRSAERIVVAGDSAGGNLALALALHAVEARLPRPAGLVLLSPWADLTHSGESFTRNGLIDPFIPPVALKRFAQVAAGGADPAGWRISPLFAPEQLWREAIPPLHIQVGSTELLLDDARAIARRSHGTGLAAGAGADGAARKADGADSAAGADDALARPAEMHVFERQPHVVPLWAGTPEARTALQLIGQFASSVLAPASSPAPPTIDDAATAAELPPEADAPRSQTAPGDP
ncbi:alpha/beta hydrolase fold domain-containing protein [Conexibacter sp. CPCC 206217]|uniref:alpha/beta hydrolase fold domain-containing protein n=1 Tax=Conexibacter sp. CPCC 206217 TaxID=3064574 RepID=UPI00271FAE29|nr:alpha/beta hydrolase fold domain-containing protein [Conexibacter sp. CPCC 206217]MDO8212860.1 alpha/beta hydrolase fold domain-containing protein [Conexibacter sp. CPCC 206217]